MNRLQALGAGLALAMSGLAVHAGDRVPELEPAVSVGISFGGPRAAAGLLGLGLRYAGPRLAETVPTLVQWSLTTGGIHALSVSGLVVGQGPLLALDEAEEVEDVEDVGEGPVTKRGWSSGTRVLVGSAIAAVAIAVVVASDKKDDLEDQRAQFDEDDCQAPMPEEVGDGCAFGIDTD